MAQREEAVLSGKLTTILFVRDKNERGQEVSGYVDYGQRLRTDNMDSVFSLKKRLMAKPSDLSFYNWETQVSASNHSSNFQVGRPETTIDTTRFSWLYMFRRMLFLDLF